MDDDRRKYWAAEMDAAYAFMLAVQDFPLAECGEPAIPLREAAAEAGVEVLFSDLPHVRGLPRLHFLRQGLVPGFLAAAREMNGRGWIMRVDDAFRTREMQKHNALRPEVFPLVLERVRWELGGKRPTTDLLRRRLAAVIAMNPRVGTHCGCSAIDISVINRSSGEEVDRGAPYLEISEKTPMGSPFVPPAARQNRTEITELMARHGFQTYPFEFWHYNAGDCYAGYLERIEGPARYGPVDLDPASGRVTPIGDPTRPLNSPEEIEARISQMLGHGA